MSHLAKPEILFDEPGLVAVNKPSGLLSEGGGEREQDLERIVSDTLGRSVWCCHRLDRLTSGVVVMRKGKLFSKELSKQFEGHAVRKEYWLLTDGVWDKRIQRVETNIASVGRGVYANVAEGGKRAVSTFQVLACSEAAKVSLVRGLLKTGRTHQLRLHAKLNGCSVLGDPLYGKPRLDGLFGLHARSVRMRHPKTGDALEFEAEVPASWTRLLEKVRA